MKQSTRQLALAGSSALLLLLADACSGSENDADDGTGGSCMPATAQSCACATPGQTGIQQCVAGTWGACQCTGPGGGGDAIPCDVQTVLNNKCLTCHGASPLYGAPPLTARSAFLGMSTTKPGTTVGKRAAERVADPTSLMPPASAPQLTPQEVAIIQNWGNQGAPAGQACQQPPQGTGGAPPMGTGGVPPIGGAGGGPGGDGGFGGTGPGGAGGVGTGGTGPTEEVTCYKILARQNTTGAKYNVPNRPDFYNCFYWEKPWGNKNVHIVSYRPIIDNSAVIHHWILYAGSEGAPGTSASCAGIHAGAAFIAGWAPGGLPETMPPDIGLQVDGNIFNLETHYNARTAGQQDASGVELCVTEQLRPKTAGVHWLGTQNLSRINASGTCSPALTEPVHILSVSPHMHVQGRHMKTIINRANGAKETLHDKPFDFNTQISYPAPATINPGDTLTTTCTYAQPTAFGSGTNAEMCYNFVTAYPVGKLVNGAGFFGRKNDCTQ